MTALEMFNKLILPRLAAQNVTSPVPALVAINAALDYLAKELIVRKSNLVQDTMSADITSGSSNANLPDDFFGFMTRPIVVETKTELDPLASGERLQYLGQVGDPERYEEKGNVLILYPTPDTDLHLVAEYWAKPVDLVMTSAVPFNGMFDQVLADMAIKISVGGLGVITDAGFAAEIQHSIDQVLLGRGKVLPRYRPTQFF